MKVIHRCGGLPGFISSRLEGGENININRKQKTGTQQEPSRNPAPQQQLTIALLVSGEELEDELLWEREGQVL